MIEVEVPDEARQLMARWLVERFRPLSPVMPEALEHVDELILALESRGYTVKKMTE